MQSDIPDKELEVTNKRLCWFDTLKVSLILAFVSMLTSELIINDIINVPTPLFYHLFIFCSSLIIAIVAFRLGWLHKHREVISVKIEL